METADPCQSDESILPGIIMWELLSIPFIPHFLCQEMIYPEKKMLSTISIEAKEVIVLKKH